MKIKQSLTAYLNLSMTLGVSITMRLPYTKKAYKLALILHISTHTHAGPRSAVGNVSGYRCVSDCRSRGREFDPGPVPYFRGD